MARLVVFKDKEPTLLTIGGETVKICRCGLTKDPKGLCDQTHLISKDEDDNATYFYDATLKRELVDLIADDEDDCCGGSCGCSHEDDSDTSTGCACGNGSCGCGHSH